MEIKINLDHLQLHIAYMQCDVITELFIMEIIMPSFVISNNSNYN